MYHHSLVVLAIQNHVNKIRTGKHLYSTVLPVVLCYLVNVARQRLLWCRHRLAETIHSHVDIQILHNSTTTPTFYRDRGCHKNTSLQCALHTLFGSHI